MKIGSAFLASLLALSFCLYPATVAASKLTPKKVPQAGIDGVWFPPEQSEKILWLLEQKLPAIEMLAAEQERLIYSQERALLTATTALSLQQMLTKTHADQANNLIVVINNQAERIDALNSIWRSPVLWLCIGALTATTIIAVTR